MSRSKYEFYQDRSNEWRWKKTSPNGKEVGNSGEGFKNFQGAVHNAQLNGYEGEGKTNVTRKKK